MRLKQFVPQEFCLKCDVCCRFYEAHTNWAPLFTESEIRHLVENNILPPLVFTRSQPIRLKETKQHTRIKNSQRINLIGYEGYFICPCFNPLNSKCKIYEDRPFECQLYPFLLVAKDHKLYLAQDKKCPYLHVADENKLSAHINYLKDELKNKEAILFLRHNKEMFTDYPCEDLKLLFPIEI